MHINNGRVFDFLLIDGVTMRIELFWLLTVFLLALAEQEVLKPDRKVQRSDNLNVGIDIAYPEQVHLSYGGLEHLK